MAARVFCNRHTFIARLHGGVLGYHAQAVACTCERGMGLKGELQVLIRSLSWLLLCTRGSHVVVVVVVVAAAQAVHGRMQLDAQLRRRMRAGTWQRATSRSGKQQKKPEIHLFALQRGATSELRRHLRAPAGSEYPNHTGEPYIFATSAVQCSDGTRTVQHGTHHRVRPWPPQLTLEPQCNSRKNRGLQRNKRCWQILASRRIRQHSQCGGISTRA